MHPRPQFILPSGSWSSPASLYPESLSASSAWSTIFILRRRGRLPTPVTYSVLICVCVVVTSSSEIISSSVSCCAVSTSSWSDTYWFEPSLFHVFDTVEHNHRTGPEVATSNEIFTAKFHKIFPPYMLTTLSLWVSLSWYYCYLGAWPTKLYQHQLSENPLS